MTKKVIVFTAPTCAPCKVLKPALEGLAKERGFELEKIELSAATAATFKQHRVSGVPVVMLQEDGQEVDRFQGGMTPTGLESRLSDWGL